MSNDYWDEGERIVGSSPVTRSQRDRLNKLQGAVGAPSDQEFLNLLIFIAVSFGPNNAFKLRNLRLKP